MPESARGESTQSPKPGEVPFYIPAVDAPARPHRSLKHNDCFAVFDSHGDIGASAGGEDGLFDHDTRYVSHMELRVAGTRPLLLHSAVSDDNLCYSVDLTNPDIYADGAIALQKDTVHIARTIYLSEGTLHERIAVVNHGAGRVSLSLSITFSCDFADIFEVRGIRRMRRGTAWSEVVDAGCARLSYRGGDAVERHSTIRFNPSPASLEASSATYDLDLHPGESQVIYVAVATTKSTGLAAPSFFNGLVARKRAHKGVMRNVATVETGNSVINEILCRSMADIYMLTTVTEDGLYPYAGIPWYSTTFGRDGIIAALEMLWIDPAIAAGVLRRLARLQATTVDHTMDSAPGKIVHEVRGGEMAGLKEIPFGLYYGSVDATPLFVVLAGSYAERTSDWRLIREIWPAIEAALEWLDEYGDLDGDGLIEYVRGTETGLSNQGWKDSHDAVFHADGRLAEGPIALVEVQGYAFAAWRAAAACATALHMDRRAIEFLAKAERLRVVFEEKYWCSDLGFYALALDGNKAPCRVRSSNAGHLLWSGIAAPERAAAVAAQLLDGELFSGWGIRTVAVGEARYNPMSYHNGSIWPHDNALVARGLEQVGAKRGVAAIFDGLMKATAYFDLRRIPELYCGFRRRPHRGPTLYPAACSPQAWAAAAPFSLIQSMLGLELHPDRAEISLRRPVIPAAAGPITLRNVRVGDATADFTLRPSQSGAAVEVLRTTGNVHISISADRSA